MRKSGRLIMSGMAMAVALLLGACGDAADGDGIRGASAAPADYASVNEALGIDVRAGAAQFDAMQERVATCMKARGFEYRFWNMQDVGIAVGSPTLAANPVEEARTNGFGVTNRVEMGSIELAFGDDPNAELFAAMSPGELEAWTFALEGDVTQGAEADGCVQRAQRDVFGVYQRLEVLSPELDALDARVQSDPRTLKFQNDWRLCVAERGFPFESPDAMIEAVMEQVAISGFEIGALVPPTATELDGVRAFETDLATADAECTAELGDVFAEVSAELEQRFVQEHAAALAEIRHG